MIESQRYEERKEVVKPKKVAIVVLGRGVGIHTNNPEAVEKCPDLQKGMMNEVKKGRGDCIEPTDYLEKAVVKDPTKGNFGPEQHPVFNLPVDPTNEPDNSRYAGAKANVAATKVLIEQLQKDPNKKLTRIYFAAGRTPDMEAYAPQRCTQGMVLAKNLVEDGMGEKLEQMGTKMVFEPNNVNTWDDIVASIKDAQDQGCDEVIIVTVAPHVERTLLMIEAALKGMTQVYGKDKVLKVKMVPSELMLINDEEEVTKMRQAMFKPFTRNGKTVQKETIGLKVVEQREKNGVKQLETGTYSSQWADGGKIAEFNKPVVEMSVLEVVNFK